MGIQINFSNLWVGDYHNKKSLKHFDSEYNSHVHGKLEIIINNNLVPNLGYFGSDDVCFNEWYRVLSNILMELQEKNEGFYEYDEGEQGQPLFLFEFDMNDVYLSILHSDITESHEDPEWRRIRFSRKEFIEQIINFKKDFENHINNWFDFTLFNS